VKAYYEARAREYDDWIEGVGVYAERHRPGWHQEVTALCKTLSSLPPASTLDVAAGSGYFTRFLPGHVVAFDQSEAMLEVARERDAAAEYVAGDALELPFEDGSFERVFTGHFYGHLDEQERHRFVAEARRIAPTLVVLDSALRPGLPHEEWQERLLRDGSKWQVYKRFFTPEELSDELGGGRTVFAGNWFVVVEA
jgi:ubiquinone/menaquinone biosynthesis C-methylase UbiE